MFEAFFTDPCMRYRTEVINGIDFYGLGFSMVRGECVAEGTLRWMQEGEAAARTQSMLSHKLGLAAGLAAAILLG